MVSVNRGQWRHTAVGMQPLTIERQIGVTGEMGIPTEDGKKVFCVGMMIHNLKVSLKFFFFIFLGRIADYKLVGSIKVNTL